MQAPGQVADPNAALEERVYAQRRLHVLLDGVDPRYVQPPLYELCDVYGPGAAAGVQAPGAWGQPYQGIYEGVVPLKEWMGRAGPDPLYTLDLVAGIAIRMPAVEFVVVIGRPQLAASIRPRGHGLPPASLVA